MQCRPCPCTALQLLKTHPPTPAYGDALAANWRHTCSSGGSESKSLCLATQVQPTPAATTGILLRRAAAYAIARRDGRKEGRSVRTSSSIGRARSWANQPSTSVRSCQWHHASAFPQLLHDLSTPEAFCLSVATQLCNVLHTCAHTLLGGTPLSRPPSPRPTITLSGFSQGHTGRASPVHRACVPPRTHSCSTHNCRHDLNQEDS
jgi:hypothetical protein